MVFDLLHFELNKLKLLVLWVLQNDFKNFVAQETLLFWEELSESKEFFSMAVDVSWMVRACIVLVIFPIDLKHLKIKQVFIRSSKIKSGQDVLKNFIWILNTLSQNDKDPFFQLTEHFFVFLWDPFHEVYLLFDLWNSFDITEGQVGERLVDVDEEWDHHNTDDNIYDDFPLVRSQIF